MEDSNQLKSTALKYGGAFGAILIVMMFVFYAISYKWFTSLTYMGLMFIIAIAVPTMAGIKRKKDSGGFLSFGHTWITMVLTYSIGAIISIVGTFLLFVVIEPELKDLLVEAQIEKTMSIMEMMGAPDEAIEQAMGEVDKQSEAIRDQFSMVGMLTQTLKFILIMAVILLIPAAIVKKKRPAGAIDEILDTE